MNKFKYILILSIILLLTGCSQDSNEIIKYSKNIFYMDTAITIIIYSDSEDGVEEALDGVANIYSEYHEVTDKYNSYDNLNNVYYINNTENKTILMDSKLTDIINESFNYYEETNGKLDIALGNALNVWKEYRESGNGVPTFSELSNVGSNYIEDIIINEEEIVLNSDVKIDLGAISKGYTTELAGNYLEENGFSMYLISAGGNIKVGDKYREELFMVGIEDPTSSNDIYTTVMVENKSVITSGGYNRYYIYEDVKYHHIIDPETLYPANYFESVTVISNNSTKGDVYSTYLFLLTLEEGLEVVNADSELEAIWYGFDGTITRSEGFSNYE